MNSKFTPGPWSADGFTIEADCNGIVVAEVRRPDQRARGKERMEDFEYCRGNAHLIAAAPDLLAALIGMVESYEHEASSENPSLLAARTAIAKAMEAA